MIIITIAQDKTTNATQYQIEFEKWKYIKLIGHQKWKLKENNKGNTK